MKLTELLYPFAFLPVCLLLYYVLPKRCRNAALLAASLLFFAWGTPEYLVLLVLAAGLPLWLWGSFAPLAAAAGYGLAVWYGYRNLDGMSGDISGFALTLGELCGCAAAILWR